MFCKNDNNKNNKKLIILFLLYLAIINLLFYITFKIIYLNYCFFNPYSQTKKIITINDGKSAKIGIISDFQLDVTKNYKDYENNVYQALKYFKDNNIDIIIIAGDITNDGKDINYSLFKQILNSVYNPNDEPIILPLMGNHDYFDKDNSKVENQKKFYNYMNSYPFYHAIINNYNFIFWSNENREHTDSILEENEWIKSSLENARQNLYRKGDPIFVISHMPPMLTMYGSESIWGNQDVYDILKDYPEVISLAGHSHYSLRNIKSIWQGEFTAINIQGLSYVDLDPYYINLKYVRKDSKKIDSMGLVGYLYIDKIVFERVEFSTREVMEEKWKIDFPIDKSKFEYTFETRNKKIMPIFNDENGIKIVKKNNNKRTFIIFDSASHPDYIYNYKILLKDKNKMIKEMYYYSDYYKNEKLRKNKMVFELPNDLNKGKYDVEIYASDSFNNTSKPKIGTIEI